MTPRAAAPRWRSPNLSVLMPVRNGATTVVPAARSTLRALGRDDELLVHDDASTDGTVGLLQAIGDRRLRVVRSEEPRGVAGGLNRLLEEARGDRVARMDADDVTLPWRFALQHRALDAGADLVFTGHLRFGSSLIDFKQKRPGATDAGTLHVWLGLENPVLHPTLAARTEVLRTAGGYRTGPAEDYDLWLRAATTGARVVRVPVPSVAYRMHLSQVTRTSDYGDRVVGDRQLGAAHDAYTRVLGWPGGPVWPVLLSRPRDPEEWSLKESYFDFLRDLAGRLPSRFGRAALRGAIDRAWPGSPD